MKRIFLVITALALLVNLSSGQQSNRKPVRIGIAGLSHSHVIPLLRNLKSQEFQIVGISESNQELAQRYSREFKIDPGIIFASLDEMLDKTKPDGVITFTSIFDHLQVVKACAPRGIHVMVEKPLAVSTKHAEAMSVLAAKYHIMVLTNYETTWYPSNQRSYEMISNLEIGTLRKIIVYDGHKGPKEINVNREFLDWLADPVQNGGGAVIDFGCYGADLITWIMKGQKPEYVYAVLKQYKPDVYPKVDDDATIILSYPSMVGIINGSWNWPFNRKDMNVYGTTGYVFADDPQNIRYRLSEKSAEKSEKLPLREAPFNNPFVFFASAIRGDITVPETDLSSLKVNMTVVEILEAARISNKTGKRVKLENR
jgi:predicted dehydrogenase